MRFTKKGYRIYGGQATVAIAALDGRVRELRVAFRVAPEYPRDGEGDYRVDINMGIGPWEACDGGARFGTAAAAQRYARRHLAAMRAQQTLTPDRGR